MVDYEVWHGDPAGVRQGREWDDLISLEWVRVVNGVGWWKALMSGDFDRSTLRIDGIQEIWRSPGRKRPSRNVLTGFLRKMRFYTDDEGNHFFEASGPDLNHIISRRIIAYAAGTSQSSKTDNVDDIIKAIARENLGSSAPAARDLSGIGFEVEPDYGGGQSLTRGFSWRDVSRVYSDLAEASARLGTEVYWEVVYQGAGSYRLQTYTGQPGQDRSIATGVNSIIFSLEAGNLENPDLVLDHSQEVTYVYAGGQGDESDREIVELEDTVRSNRSIWGRIEAFVDARNESTTAGVTAAANERLRDGKPRLYFTGSLLDTEQTRFGLDWFFGDKVTVFYQGYELTGIIKAVHVHVDDSGVESVDARFEVQDVL